MLYQSNGESRTKLKAVPRKAAVKGGKGSNFSGTCPHFVCPLKVPKSPKIRSPQPPRFLI